MSDKRKRRNMATKDVPKQGTVEFKARAREVRERLRTVIHDMSQSQEVRDEAQRHFDKVNNV